jgi:hypothetical protein
MVMLFGSVTEAVVRKAQCPVMVVKAPVHEAMAPSRPMVGQTASTATATAAAVPNAPHTIGR